MKAHDFRHVFMTVITLGAKLVEGVQAGAEGGSSALEGFVMGISRFLFQFNLLSTPFGWQVVAVVRKASA